MRTRPTTRTPSTKYPGCPVTCGVCAETEEPTTCQDRYDVLVFYDYVHHDVHSICVLSHMLFFHMVFFHNVFLLCSIMRGTHLRNVPTYSLCCAKKHHQHPLMTPPPATPPCALTGHQVGTATQPLMANQWHPIGVQRAVVHATPLLQD